MVQGFIEQYRAGGWIARWSSPGYADLMVGTSSDVAFADAFQPRIGKRHIGTGADHQVCVAWRRPACDPAASTVLLDEALHHLPGIVGREQRIGIGRASGR